MQVGVPPGVGSGYGHFEALGVGVEPAFAAKQLGHTTEMFLNIYADWVSGVKDKDQVNLLANI